MRRLVVLVLGAAIVAAGPSVSFAALDTKAKCHGFQATKVGTDRSEVIRGTDHRDVILAKGGADRVFTGDGNDIICAGPGNDLVEGGPGKDRIFGSGGNDTLRGGPGHDRLEGEGGLDGCYPAAGNDKLVDCEEADLVVTIDAPVSVNDALPFELTVRVANDGSTRSAPYDLAITATQSEVLCGPDPSGTTPFQAVWPGAFVEADYAITEGCVIQSGGDPHFSITATLVMDNRDADPSNDEATVRIEIEPAVTIAP